MTCPFIQDFRKEDRRRTIRVVIHMRTPGAPSVERFLGRSWSHRISGTWYAEAEPSWDRSGPEYRRAASRILLRFIHLDLTIFLLGRMCTGS